MLEVLEDRLVLSTLTVTDAADTAGAANDVTLRYAIGQVNAGACTQINFDIGSLGTSQTITLGSALPAISKPVFINGLSQNSGSNTSWLITVTSGASITDGLQVSSSGCVISGLIIGGFNDGIEVSASTNTIGGTAAGAGNVLSGNGTYGMLIDNGVSGVQVQGNYIGINAAGTAAQANSGVGIEISGFNDTIGGTVAGARNVISGNTSYGVGLSSPASGIVIQGNYIGTNAGGYGAVANVNYGIWSWGTNVTIGGTSAAARNVISGNGSDGILLNSLGAGHVIQGNYIGTDATGSFAVANGTGIEVDLSNNTIGGTAAGAGNVISGNTNDGVLIQASGVTVQGNDLGTNAAGSGSVTNFNGIEVKASGNTIGGTAVGAGNVASGNLDAGIYIDSGVSNVQVQGNFLGTNTSGTAIDANFYGVVDYGSNTTIGGTTAAARNIISGNGQTGLALGSSGVTVQGNYIGTDVTGSKALANFEGITSAPGNTIGGTTATARNVISGNHYGLWLNISGVTVQGNYIGTDATGSFAVGNSIGVDVLNPNNNDVVGGAAGAGNVISGNTQNGVLIDNFASGVTVQGNYIGTDATGSYAVGNGSGVEVNANNNTIGGLVTSGASNIISGNSSFGILIDSGISGVAVQGNYIGTDATGNYAVANYGGVEILGANNTVGGTANGARNVISGNSEYGVGTNTGGAGDVVQGNYIGTNAAGNAAVANNFGVWFYGSNDTIGGTSTAARNIISGNSGDGVLINNNTAVNDQIQGNYIGTDVSGTNPLANSYGVAIYTANNTVGGTANGARNIISGNIADGIYLGASNVAVLGNYIGANTSGGGALANGTGIEVAASNNTLGGTTTAARNIISGNDHAGILIDSSISGVAVLGNYVGAASSGTTALSNANGIEIYGTNNTVGGTASAARNIISGNQSDGLFIGNGGNGNWVFGNYLGTNYAGNVVLGNGQNGVEIAGNSNNLGGSVTGARNVISGNGNDGLLLDSSANSNFVLSDYVGTVANGTSALGNSANGIEVAGTGNEIGYSAPVYRNVVSSNAGDGILLDSTAAGNFVLDNFIGTIVAGSAALGNGGNGIEVYGSNNILGGTTAGSRNVIASNQLDGVLVNAGATGNQVLGNDIGLNASGTSALGNSVHGVELQGSNNAVGGASAAARNIISGNGGDGVLIDSGSTGDLVQGNFIGLNSSGSAVLGNSSNGIEIYGANNTIGSSVAGAHNVISGNGGDGVLIEPGASGAVVQGNYIGTDNTGKVKLGNSGSGVEVGDNGALIGGTSVASRNLISGNSFDGVLIDGGVSGTRVQNNYIGTDVTGTVALANFNGIEVQGNGSLIGGTTAAARNIIAGNTSNGVQIDAGATGNGVQGNYIGLSASMTALANSGYGVSIAGSNNTIGGSVPAAANSIAFNSLGGVQVSAGNGNTIRRNSIYSNGPSNTGPGIVLAPGANNNLAAPIISTATLNGTILTVTGTFNAPVANVPYVLEFFVSPAGDPEGKIYIGKLTVTPTGTGNQPFTFTTSTTAANATTLITATLTDNSGDTSAFSNGVTS